MTQPCAEAALSIPFKRVMCIRVGVDRLDVVAASQDEISSVAAAEVATASLRPFIKRRQTG